MPSPPTSPTTSPLPEHGRPAAEVLNDLSALGAQDPDYKHGRLWSLVYWLDEDYDRFLGQAWQRFSSANGLNPGAFRSLRRMEAQIVTATAQLHHGDDQVCGVLTSGGTESCLLAAKTWRDHARRTRGVSRPQMVLAPTAHVAWYKACEYFDLEPCLLPLDADGLADASQLEALLTDQTALVVASAPNYPNGGIDPIEALGAIAQRRGVPVHVDACVGGFILPFMAMNGRALPAWDWRVPGVMSISADLHKYGYAAKGASVISYRNLDLMKHQMFAKPQWTGGMFGSPAMLGTRPGGAYAAAWAAMQHHGVDGYRALAARAIDAFDRLRAGVAAMPQLRVLGRPHGPLLAYGAREPAALSIHAVGDRMDARGWRVNRVQQPDGLHAMITAQHLDVAERYLDDLRAAVAEVQADPTLAQAGSAASYGQIAAAASPDMAQAQFLDLFARSYRRR